MAVKVSKVYILV